MKSRRYNECRAYEPSYDRLAVAPLSHLGQTVMVAPDVDDSSSSPRQFNTRLGLILFAFYLALYSGFVLINAYRAEAMETIVFAGLNLAIVYGFSLIVMALILAVIYGIACRAEPKDDSGHQGEKSGGGTGE